MAVFLAKNKNKHNESYFWIDTNVGIEETVIIERRYVIVEEIVTRVGDRSDRPHFSDRSEKSEDRVPTLV